MASDSKSFWDDRFKSREFIYGVQPNAFFKRFLEGRKAGHLLLPAEGEGRNAVYAAARGWDVDAFDISTEAKKKALKLADERKVDIHYFNSDMRDVSLEERTYDLIALIFAHMPSRIRRSVHRSLIEALKPGGYLIIEAFSKKQIDKNSGGPPNIDMLYDMDSLRKDFKSLKIETLSEDTQELDEGMYHDGEAHLIHFIGRKPQ